MGEYLLFPKGSPRPTILSPEMLGLEQPSVGIFARAASAIGGTSRAASTAQSVSRFRRRSAAAPPQTQSGGSSPRGDNKVDSPRRRSASRNGSSGGGRVTVLIDEEVPLPCPVLPLQKMRLFQILSPATVARGRYFGNHLTIKPDWIQVDRPYFDAPGMNLSFILIILRTCTLLFCFSSWP